MADVSAELARRQAGRHLEKMYADTYENCGKGPYNWQVEFHAAEKDNAELCLLAANRTGKTETAAAAIALHTTGLYPDWYPGVRFEKGISVWTGAVTNEASRDIIQKALLGSPHGTGWIPADKILKVTYRQAGVSEVVDTITVKHKRGKSTITLKTYDQGRAKWQGTSKHIVWLDEEAPMDVFTEALTRTLDVKGKIFLTFTPLLGSTPVVQHFIDGGPGIFVKNVTWDDAPHLDKDEMARLALSYPEWERDTRMKGIPMMGEGAVFPVKDEDLMCDPFEIPKHWGRINGVDFGIAHPAAGAAWAWDRDTDTMYLYDCYAKSGETPVYHAEWFRRIGGWIPVAWPKDGLQRDKGSGIALKDQYRSHGCKMMKEWAAYKDERGVSIEAGVIEMLEYMRAGKLKVFSTCQKFFAEKRMYHRKDGKINPINDDIISAARYGFVMRRKSISFSLAALGGQRKKTYTRPIVGGRR